MHKNSQNGFTLVELAIVLMIIGLLISGILRGQELIQNARINATLRQLKSYDAASLTFIDSYAALAGDITNPGTRLPNCAGQCATAGDGNGTIGIVNFDGSSTTNEQNTFWLHLNAANLISGIDTAKSWGGNPNNGYYPPIPIGGNAYIVHFSSTPTAFWPNGANGHYYHIGNANGAGQSTEVIPVNVIERIDRKADDGKPFTGDIMIGSGNCNIASGGDYNANNTTGCIFYSKANF